MEFLSDWSVFEYLVIGGLLGAGIQLTRIERQLSRIGMKLH